MEEKTSSKAMYVVVAIASCLLLVASSVVFFFVGRVTAPKKQATQTSAELPVQSQLGTQKQEGQETKEPGIVAGETIAVVNLDEGIEEDGQLSNYAKEIMDTIKSGYEMTSLNDARNGLASGKYGAFVIIPADFSASVLSLRSTPKKATIQYCLNSQLKEDRASDVLFNTLQLVNNVNNDVSYIYLNAILKKFHYAQDIATTLMNNDKNLTDSILNIQPIKLSDVVQPEKLEELKAPVMPTVTDETETSDKLANDINDTYTRFIDNKDQEFGTLNTTLRQQLRPVDETNTTMQSLDVSMDKYNPIDFNNPSYSTQTGLMDKEPESVDTKGEKDAMLGSVDGYKESIKSTLLNRFNGMRSPLADVKKDIDDMKKQIADQGDFYTKLISDTLWKNFNKFIRDQITSELFGKKDTDAYKAINGFAPEISLVSMEDGKQKVQVKMGNYTETYDLGSTIDETGKVDAKDFLVQLNGMIKQHMETNDFKDDVKAKADSLTFRKFNYNDLRANMPSDTPSTNPPSTEAPATEAPSTDDPSASIVPTEPASEPSKSNKKASKHKDSNDDGEIIGGGNQDQNKPGDGKESNYDKLFDYLKGFLTVDKDGNFIDYDMNDFSADSFDDQTKQIENAYQKVVKDRNQRIYHDQDYLSQFSRNTDRFKEQLKNNQTAHEDLTKKLEGFSVKYEDKGGSIVNALDSIAKLCTTITDKISGYKTATDEYASNVQTSAQHNQATLIQQMNDAQKESEKTVNDELLITKQLQTNNSSTNQTSLLDLTKQLPYTRLGKNEYKAAYRFMITPFDLMKVKLSIGN